MFSILLTSTIAPNHLLVLLLTLIALASIFPLIVLVEMVILQLMRWGKFKSCIKAAIQVNGATFFIGIILVFIVPKPELWQLLIFLVLAILIEATLLNHLKPNTPQANWTVSILSNLVSYTILILPAFQFQ